jgi:hypothetical protein
MNDEAELPGYVRAYTGPTQIKNEWPFLMERRVVIHRMAMESKVLGVPPYAVHEESRGKSKMWTLHGGTFGLRWKDAIDIARKREDTLLCTLNRVLPLPRGHGLDEKLNLFEAEVANGLMRDLLPASDPRAPVPGRPPVENESYRLSDQPTAERYIELTVTVGGASYTGRLYRD